MASFQLCDTMYLALNGMARASFISESLHVVRVYKCVSVPRPMRRGVAVGSAAKVTQQP